jgi:hypothetical protein
MGYQTKKFVPRPMKILTEYLKKKNALIYFLMHNIMIQ